MEIILSPEKYGFTQVFRQPKSKLVFGQLFPSVWAKIEQISSLLFAHQKNGLPSRLVF